MAEVVRAAEAQAAELVPVPRAELEECQAPVAEAAAQDRVAEAPLSTGTTNSGASSTAQKRQ